ncbi:hypothetical protein HMPREF9081_0308 [Centipeda periodontii DSM 2778]|uniref:Uncharacterized protein n=1 Tax=Centipeda periodontii DSM 2778 TaxID=888060 RepID=F5RJ73_9FIRM|nr:hypothetical protein HMPREF9081_0308 [Centipeda periodontii DSM 2778]
MKIFLQNLSFTTVRFHIVLFYNKKSELRRFICFKQPVVDL